MNNNGYRDNNYNNNVMGIKILISICLIAVGALGMYGIIQVFPSTTVVNKLEKEVTVNERGIADAVEKVYDSVVVVENFKNNKLVATGTGFVFKQDGKKYYMLTNYHVIEGNTSIKVVFTDDTEVDVTYVGGDKYADIAVLELQSSKDLTIAQMGSSTDARVGDTLFAVGAPLDSSTYSWSVTRGILSGKDRMVAVSTSTSSSSDYIMKVLQTDAAINSGNSGGPLCNSNGEVIGITNMKLAASGIEGMGFAIPIEDALEFSNKIMNGDDITRPVLGLSMIELNVAEAYYKFEVPENVSYGVVVANVENKSSAADAGIEVEDIIMEFDNVKIDSTAKLKYELYRHNVGDTVNVKINRNGIEKVISIKLKK